MLQGSIIIDQKLFYSVLGDSMRSLIGLKNMLIFSSVLLAIGSVSAQQAFAGGICDCTSGDSGDWDAAFDCGVPSSLDTVCIDNADVVQLDGVGLANGVEIIDGSLLIACDGDLTADKITVFPQASLINHGSVNIAILSTPGLTQNSSSAFTVGSVGDGGIENISTICSQPIGGTVGSLDTTTLLVAGAQANMGLWSLALVGMVGAGAAITYKLKSKKTEQ